MGKSSRKNQATTKDTPAAALTKKQIARSRKEAQQLRIIWISVAAVGVIVLGVLAFALIREAILIPNAAVAVVDGEKITATDFQDLLTYRRYSLHNNITSLNYQLQSFDTTSEENQFLVSFYQQQLTQLESLLDQAPQDALDELIEDELIKQKAAEVGLAVTPEEIAQQIQSDLQSSFVEQTGSITATTPISTPTPVPQDALDQRYQQAIEAMMLSDKAFRRVVGRSMLRSEVSDLFASQVITTGLVAHVQLIPADSQETAEATQKRIEAGEDFATVAQEVYSSTQGIQNDGDIGWVTTGQVSSTYGIDLENAVFAMDVNKVTTVQSNDQFYVVVVVERNENGPLPADVISSRQGSALTDWLEQQKEASGRQNRAAAKAARADPARSLCDRAKLTSTERLEAIPAVLRNCGSAIWPGE